MASPEALVVLALALAWLLAMAGLFVGYRVFQYLMKQNAELVTAVLSLSRNESAAHLAGFTATARANREQRELIETLRARGAVNGEPPENLTEG